ncbi:MAG: hypothetical protein ACR2NX_10510, partial [Chthoniobacterales bacterium]
MKEEPWENFRDRYGDWGRDLALWLGRTQCGLKLRELGEQAGGIDYATVSAATARWEKRAATDRRLMKWQNRALQILNAKMWGCPDLTDSGLRVKTPRSPHENTDQKAGARARDLHRAIQTGS